MVRATVEHVLGEISRRWELLKQIYGHVPPMFLWPDVISTSNAHTSTRNKQKDHVLPRDTRNLEKHVTICDYEENKKEELDRNFDAVCHRHPA